jgi:hypothetical protein
MRRGIEEVASAKATTILGDDMIWTNRRMRSRESMIIVDTEIRRVIMIPVDDRIYMTNRPTVVTDEIDIPRLRRRRSTMPSIRSTHLRRITKMRRMSNPTSPSTSTKIETDRCQSENESIPETRERRNKLHPIQRVDTCLKLSDLVDLGSTSSPY